MVSSLFQPNKEVNSDGHLACLLMASRRWPLLSRLFVIRVLMFRTGFVCECLSSVIFDPSRSAVTFADDDASTRPSDGWHNSLADGQGGNTSTKAAKREREWADVGEKRLFESAKNTRRGWHRLEHEGRQQMTRQRAAAHTNKQKSGVRVKKLSQKCTVPETGFYFVGELFEEKSGWSWLRDKMLIWRQVEVVLMITISD